MRNNTRHISFFARNFLLVVFVLRPLRHIFSSDKNFLCRNPNFPVTVPESIVWPEYNLDTKRFLLIERNQSKASQNLFGPRAAFWLDIEPKINALESKPTDSSGSVLPSIVG